MASTAVSTSALPVRTMNSVLVPAEKGHPLGARDRLAHRESGLGENPAEQRTNLSIVVHDQHADAIVHVAPS
jgi:hypothetical protein